MAYGTVSANSDFGPGGYIQYYIPDYDEVLKFIDVKKWTVFR